MAGLPIARRPSEVRVEEIAAKSALNRVRGMGFTWSLNPFTGCAHQCVFCYARARHRTLPPDEAGMQLALL